MLATKGKRVILADFDPQCNLTGMVMGFKGVDDLAATYRANPPNNVKDGLAPAFESQPKQIVGVECIEVPGNANLFLLPGHTGLADTKPRSVSLKSLAGLFLHSGTCPVRSNFFWTPPAPTIKPISSSSI